jgi:hypothetical protein
MSFKFVNNASIDRSTRKLIRSHAAKGKNVGKKHPSRRKQTVLRAKLSLPLCNVKGVEETPAHESEEPVLPIERQIGDGLSVLLIPAELSPRSKVLVQRGIIVSKYLTPVLAKHLLVFTFISGPLHPPELCNAIDFPEAPAMWIQFIFLDKACIFFAHKPTAFTLLTVLRFPLLRCHGHRGPQSPPGPEGRLHRSNEPPFPYLPSIEPKAFWE